MKKFLAGRLGLVVLLCVSGCKEQSPNVIFILADDLGYVDVGGYAERITGTKPADQALAYLEQRASKKDEPFLLYFNHFAVHGPW